MAKEKKKVWIAAVFLLFVVYFFAAARPIPRETVLKARWLSSLESNYPLFLDDPSRSGTLDDEPAANPLDTIPFALGGRFGYLDSNGRFTINQAQSENISLSETKWARYGASPESVAIVNNVNDTVETVENPRGYPLFLDGRTFILGSEQNVLSETDGKGGLLWTYEFAAPLTCADASGGLVLAGSIDGVVEVLDSGGKRLFSFAPGGSRYSLVLGCAFSRNGERFAVVCGIGEQRFLLLERFGASGGGEYKVTYHEFLGDGYRRPVHIAFIDDDRRIVFERESGIGIYDINTRVSHAIALDGSVTAIDKLGSGGKFFVIVDSYLTGQKKLVGINLPQKIFMQAPFTSDDVFLGRTSSRLFVGGGTILASFELEEQ